MFRVSFNMVLQSQGWSYVLYKDGASAVDVVKDLTTDEFIAPILAIHNTSCFLESVAVAKVGTQAQENPPRQVAKKTLMKAGTGGPAQSVSPDVTSVAVRCQLFTATGKTRPLYLRGLPDEWTRRAVATGAMALVTNLTRAIENLVGFNPPQGGRGLIPQNNFFLRYRLPPTADGMGFRDVIEVSPLGGGVHSLLTTQGNHGWLANQRILISTKDVCGLAGYSGEHKIIDVPAPNQLRIAVTYRDRADSFTPAGMKARRSVYETETIVGGEPVALRHRDTGRPRSITRGRERSRSCR